MKVISTNEQEILDTAVENIDNWYTYWNDNIIRGKEAVRFCMGNQWTDQEISDYNRLGKVRLTLNKLDAYVQQAIGEYRQNLPDIQIRPFNEQVPDEIIEQIEGYIRHISHQSNSDIIYSTALEDILIRGFGAIEIYYEYKDNNSFDYIPKLRRIEDATRVFFDPHAKEVTKMDSEWAGLYYDMSKKEFKEKHPKIEYPSSFAEPTRMASTFWWGDEDNIRLCKYYQKERFKNKLLLLNNGIKIKADKFKQIKEHYPDIQVVRERPIDDYIIKGYKFIKDQIVEESTWPSKYLPIIFARGKTYYHEGLEHTKSYIENAEDIQKFLNYVVSASAQILKQSHKGKYMMTKDQATALNDQELYYWKTPDVASLLIADPDKKTGQMPQPVMTPPIPPELLTIWQGADANIEGILGRYGAVKGMDSNELSGKAIANKIMQGNLLFIPSFTNMEQVVKHIGCCLLDLIPNISYEGQQVPLLKADKKQTTAPLNVNSMQDYEYLVSVEGGTNFAMQKQQNLQILINFVQLMGPNNAPLFADLIAELLDLPNVNKIIERVKENVLPPQVRAQESGQPLPPQPPDPQMMMEQQKQQVQAQQAQADLMKAQADIMDAKRKIEEGGTKREIATTKAEAEIQKAEIDLRSAMAKAIHSGKEESLSRENETLKTELNRHQQMMQVLE